MIVSTSRGGSERCFVEGEGEKERERGGGEGRERGHAEVCWQFVYTVMDTLSYEIFPMQMTCGIILVYDY